MEGIKKYWIVPFLVVVMLLFSSLITMGAGASNEELKNTASYVYREVLIIYDNSTLAEEWKMYLESLGYHMINFLPYDGLKNAQYDNYGLVIIATDSHYLNSYDFKILLRSQARILGVGVGGVYGYIQMGYNGYYSPVPDSTTNILVKKNLSVYNYPYQISGVPGELTIFDTPANRVYMGDASQLNNSQSISIGFFPGNTNYPTIIQIENYLFFGYTQAPSHLTSDGDKLLKNLIRYMNNRYGTNTNIGIPRIYNRININGFLSISEWLGAKKVYLDTDYNYLYLAEDESYLYIGLYLKNSSYTSDFIDVWFERDNNRTDGVDTSVFYLIFQEYYGLAYREADGYNSWGPFKNLDGVNIDGKANFTSSRMTAEIKISKSYLGISPDDSNLMGFGVMYRYESVIKAYPTTFNWRDAQSAITVYSLNHWKGQIEYLNSKRWVSPTIDGIYENDEWYGSSYYTITHADGRHSQIRVCHDDNNLYFGGYIPNVSGYSSVLYLYFDTDSNGGDTPQTDDFQIWGGKGSSNTIFAYEHYGDGSGWGATQSLTDAEMKFALRADRLYFELRLAFSKLGITPGNYKEIKMQIATNAAGSTYKIPTTALHTVPSTWNISLYSQSFWSSDQMTLDAHNGNSVNIDGDLYEWNDVSFFYTFPTKMGKDIYVYMKTSEEHLIIGLRYYKPLVSSTTNFQLGFDVGYDRGVPQQEDFVILIFHSGGTKEYRGNSTTSWWDEVVPAGWSYAMDNSSTTGWTVEISIEFSKLGITQGIPSKIGFVLFLREASGSSHSPVSSDFSDLGTWNTITSSDDWQEYVIPEFGTLAFISLSVLLIAAVIVRRKK